MRMWGSRQWWGTENCRPCLDILSNRIVLNLTNRTFIAIDQFVLAKQEDRKWRIWGQNFTLVFNLIVEALCNCTNSEMFLGHQSTYGGYYLKYVLTVSFEFLCTSMMRAMLSGWLAVYWSYIFFRAYRL